MLANLLAFYPFEGDANDASGNGLHGTLNGATATGAGFQGGAYQFDGTNDYISLPLNINPSAQRQLTIGAWAKADKTTARQAVISHDDGGFDRALMVDDRGGGVGWSAFSGSGGALGFEPVQLGAWTFLAAVYDQDAGTVTL